LPTQFAKNIEFNKAVKTAYHMLTIGNKTLIKNKMNSTRSK